MKEILIKVLHKNGMLQIGCGKLIENMIRSCLCDAESIHKALLEDVIVYKDVFFEMWNDIVTKFDEATKNLEHVSVNLWVTDCDNNLEHLRDWAEPFFDRGVKVDKVTFSCDICLIETLRKCNTKKALLDAIDRISNILRVVPYANDDTPEVFWRVEGLASEVDFNELLQDLLDIESCVRSEIEVNDFKYSADGSSYHCTFKQLPTILHMMADYYQEQLEDGLEDDYLTEYFAGVLKTGLFHDAMGKVGNLNVEEGTATILCEY